MTYFEAKIAIETDQDLNQVTNAIHAGLFAADLDPLGVTVEEFDTKPVYDVADETEEYEEVTEFGGKTTRYPLPRHTMIESLVEALKENGDRYRG